MRWAKLIQRPPDDSLLLHRPRILWQSNTLILFLTCRFYKCGLSVALPWCTLKIFSLLWRLWYWTPNVAFRRWTLRIVAWHKRLRYRTLHVACRRWTLRNVGCLRRLWYRTLHVACHSLILRIVCWQCLWIILISSKFNRMSWSEKISHMKQRSKVSVPEKIH